MVKPSVTVLSKNNVSTNTEKSHSTHEDYGVTKENNVNVNQVETYKLASQKFEVG